MKFRFTIETLSQNGTRDASVQDLEKDVIVLGRGGDSDIIFESRFVSLTHAKVFEEGGQPYIEDISSNAGLLVNAAVVNRHALRRGDKIKLGDITLEVRAVGLDSTELALTRTPADKVDLDTRVANDFSKLQLARYMPSFRIISIVLMTAVVVALFIMPLTVGDKMPWTKMSWSTGPITGAHRFVDNDCQACHNEAFKRIPDAKCNACHNITTHAELFTAHSGIEASCASCHMDHNGDGALLLKESELCTSCHANIQAQFKPFGKKTSILNVPSFEKHPQFSVTLQSERPGQPGRKVFMDDIDNLFDNSHIKLNHALHLQKDLRTKTGRTTLDCQYCHKVNSDFRTINKINFEQNCRECHSLEFDERLPKVEVPHGNPDVVYPFLYAEYAKLLLANPESSQRRETFQRLGGRIPGKAIQTTDAEDPSQFSRAFVEKESRGAERTLFTKTACLLCHDVSEKRIAEDELRDKGLSRFDVVKADIPERWMPASVFSHGAHEEIQCEGCHEGVRESKKTSDILLPKLQSCQDCHVQHPVAGKVRADCVTCHSYHDSKLMPTPRKRAIKDIVRRAAPEG